MSKSMNIVSKLCTTSCLNYIQILNKRFAYHHQPIQKRCPGELRSSGKCGSKEGDSRTVRRREEEKEDAGWTDEGGRRRKMNEMRGRKMNGMRGRHKGQ
eukprot:8713751-Pyramimonas_sp.AAC.1